MAKVKNAKSADLAQVKEHYEDYPYPFRDPEEESKRLIQTVGEYLGEMNHWLYQGKEDFNSGFRVLIAGGGTGDATVFLAEQLKDKNAEIVYLDFSKASMEIAKKRAEKRGLKNIKWINDSILNIPNLKLGKFDFIDCTGVLHHLASPPDGLKALQSVLTPKGGMSLMVYAKYGRTGVYHVQEIMKMVNEGINNRVEEIMNGKAIINNLPATNWYNRAKELLGDHISFGDIGLYDMFLHKQDRAYSIPELYEFLENASLHAVEFSAIQERLALRIENYIKDFSLLQKLKKKDIITQQAICEIMVGNIIKHSIFASNQKNPVATLEDLNNVPYFYGIANVPQQIFNHIHNNGAAVGNTINLKLDATFIKDVNITIGVSNLTKYIFKNMIESSKSLQEIFDSIREELQTEITDEVLINEVKTTFAPFLTTGVMLLRDKSVNF